MASGTSTKKYPLRRLTDTNEIEDFINNLTSDFDSSDASDDSSCKFNIFFSVFMFDKDNFGAHLTGRVGFAVRMIGGAQCLSCIIPMITLPALNPW